MTVRVRHAVPFFRLLIAEKVKVREKLARVHSGQAGDSWRESESRKLNIWMPVCTGMTAKAKMIQEL
jgi:hypothetical protein